MSISYIFPAKAAPTERSSRAFDTSQHRQPAQETAARLVFGGVDENGVSRLVPADGGGERRLKNRFGAAVVYERPDSSENFTHRGVPSTTDNPRAVNFYGCD